MSDRLRHPLSRWQCAQAAFAIVLAQLALALALSSPDPDPRATYGHVVFPQQWQADPPRFDGWIGRYRRLNNFDSLHYLSIAEFGYRRTERPTPLSIDSYLDNYAFFPAFPLAGRTVSRLLHLPTDIGLLVTAQAFAVAAWTYFFLILRSLGVPAGTTLLAGAWVACFPSALFLVLGYTESLFLTGLLGMIYWYRRSGASRWAVPVAALHGLAMTADRPVGLPLVTYPLFCEAFRLYRREKPSFGRAALVSATGSLGYLGFFAYLKMRFGDWRVFFEVQKIGWNNAPQYLAPLNPLTYLPDFTQKSELNMLNQALAPAFLALILWQLRKLPRDRELPVDLGWGVLYLAAGLLYTLIAGKSGVGMSSMLRYCLPLAILLSLLWAAGRRGDAWAAPSAGRKAALALLFLLQLGLMWRQIAGYFVA